MKQRVEAELNKSLDFYDRLVSFEGASAVIADMINHRHDLVAVINGRVFAHAGNIKGVRDPAVFFIL